MIGEDHDNRSGRRSRSHLSRVGIQGACYFVSLEGGHHSGGSVRFHSMNPLVVDKNRRIHHRPKLTDHCHPSGCELAASIQAENLVAAVRILAPLEGLREQPLEQVSHAPGRKEHDTDHEPVDQTPKPTGHKRSGRGHSVRNCFSRRILQNIYVPVLPRVCLARRLARRAVRSL